MLAADRDRQGGDCSDRSWEQELAGRGIDLLYKPFQVGNVLRITSGVSRTQLHWGRLRCELLLMAMMLVMGVHELLVLMGR